MSSEVIKYMLIVVAVLFAVIVVAYLMMRKKLQSSEAAQIRKLRQGTTANTFSMEVTYQKLYNLYIRTPFLKRYLFKIRRRLEIINIDDEYMTRKQTSSILTRALLILIPMTMGIVIIAKNNMMLMSILLIFELFIIDSILDGMVDKIDNKLLTEQMKFFAEIRHAYHEFNMVEEAIYQVSQDDDNVEMSRQAQKIYEILISNDPEGELEKYYDIAPNSYLKEFAGVSYLTKEFGDRKIDKSSLYLKNLNNINQEMQLEILKRDKLNYTFQSLSVISIAPILALEPIKNWAMDQFSFTEAFYKGKDGMLAQIAIVVLTFICYILTRKLKDNGSTTIQITNEHPWQDKVYNLPLIKNFVDLFIPKDGTKERRNLTELFKDAATKQKIEWFYVTRLTLTILVFIASFVLLIQLHALQVHYIMTEPTETYNIVGKMSEKDQIAAMQLTEQDNKIIEKFRGDNSATTDDLKKVMVKDKDTYGKYTQEQLDSDASRILDKLKQVNAESLKWFEVLIAMVFAILGYNGPKFMLMFQARMRKLEMEDEVMQYQTIILMLMRIERVNIEMILEWLERYANIFKEPISRCVNNYEAGPWEALEQLKDEVNYEDLIRIVESLQAAVEKIPIAEAFDELDSERDYYQAKRQETNERLIARKSRIGKAIGFAPMIVLFVGYLIIPLCVIGMTSMSESFTTMQAQSKKFS